MSNSDRWVNEWKMHQDPDGILSGITDLAFSLERAEMGNLVAYKMRSESVGTNPFENTIFVEFGSRFPSVPQVKLEPWTKDEESAYVKLIDETFHSSSADVKRLHGEKVVGGVKEFLTLLLIPEATKVGNADPARGDLIVMLCATKNRNPPSRNEQSGGKAKLLVLQDGTAHGNPK